MGKTRNNPKGFSTIEALLVLVIAGIVGFTGWYVYHSQQSANKNLAATSSSTIRGSASKSAAGALSGPTAGWKASTCSNGSILLGADMTSGGNCQGDGGAQIQGVSVAGDVSKGYRLSGPAYPDLITTSVVINGTSGVKQTATLENQGNEGLGAPNGTKVEQYIFYAKGRTYLLAYNQYPKYTDVSADFELLVTRTFSLK